MEILTNAIEAVAEWHRLNDLVRSQTLPLAEHGKSMLYRLRAGDDVLIYAELIEREFYHLCRRAGVSAIELWRVMTKGEFVATNTNAPGHDAALYHQVVEFGNAWRKIVTVPVACWPLVNQYGVSAWKAMKEQWDSLHESAIVKPIPDYVNDVWYWRDPSTGKAHQFDVILFAFSHMPYLVPGDESRTERVFHVRAVWVQVENTLYISECDW